MEFTLKINLDNAEAEERGVDVALPEYLAAVADAVGYANLSGKVRDGNGNTIGQWVITEG